MTPTEEAVAASRSAAMAAARSVNMLTPSTKDAVHDVPISAKDIVESGRMSAEDYEKCEKAAMAIFAFGQVRARATPRRVSRLRSPPDSAALFQL